MSGRSCKRIARTVLCLFVLALQLAGCSAGYYWQAAVGQMRLVGGRQPVDELLAQSDLSPTLRERLILSQEALSFAHQELKLPDNGSYTTYYDTGHSYIVWNVFAAPEFSLQPQTWCFPIAGCIAYRGYFNPDKANKYAAKLATKSNDVYVGGITAYSTLGRFKDPVLNTMVSMPSLEFTGLLFHELAHQRLYIKDDSAFNEGFASVVEQIGVARWRGHRGLPADSIKTQAFVLQRQQVMELFAATRVQLEALYLRDVPDIDKRPAKAAILTALGDAYFHLLAQWQDAGWRARPYEALMLQGINNASLGAIATYTNYVPAFQALYHECNESLDCFYRHCEQLGALDVAPREAALRTLQAGTAGSGL